MELEGRLAALDPIAQRHTLEMRARLWHDGSIAREETSRLSESLYFVQEILLLLEDAGFRDVTVESGYAGTPVTPEDAIVMIVARK
jgi:sugar phosphate isomerase/epimerase